MLDIWCFLSFWKLMNMFVNSLFPILYSYLLKLLQKVRLIDWLVDFCFGHAPHHGMWDLSFLTRDWTCTPYSGSMKSLPPDCQESHSPRPLTIQVLDLLDYLIFSSIFYRINLYKVQKNMQVKRFLHLHSRYKT